MNASRVATCQTGFPTLGSRSITAVYSGDTNYLPSTSTPLAQRVVNGNVAGISFSNVRVNDSTAPPPWPSAALARSEVANYTCTVSSTSNNDKISGNVVFVAANGTTAIGVRQ